MENVTIFFTQCKNCIRCDETPQGFWCTETGFEIDNPNVDGCTWGIEKEGAEDGIAKD